MRPSAFYVTMPAMQGNRHIVVILALLALAGLALWANQPDPATVQVDYRPGGYFPPEAPLQGEVKLLSSPVTSKEPLPEKSPGAENILTLVNLKQAANPSMNGIPNTWRSTKPKKNFPSG